MDAEPVTSAGGWQTQPVLADWCARIQAAAQQGTRVQICGGGSKAFYAPIVEEGNADRIDTRVLNGIISYEPSELVVCAWAGTPLTALESLLAAHGQCLSFEPPHFAENATVGGMVVSGLAGPARVSAGSVRDHILGVQMINGRAELLNFGGTVIKNVAGYDVSRVLVGSLGTLGIITQVNLKVLPMAPAQATLRFAGRTQPDALMQLWACSGQPLPLNASSWQGGEEGGVLHVRLRGAQAAVASACQRLGGERLGDGAAAAHWRGCRDQTLPWFQAALKEGKNLWRLAIPHTALPMDLSAIGDPIPFVEWHGGQRWIAVCPESAHQTAEILRTAAAQAGGHATLFRGCSDACGALITRFQPLPPALFAMHQRLKQAFDPAGVFADLPWQASVIDHAYPACP